jgi:hypothetical protein
MSKVNSLGVPACDTLSASRSAAPKRLSASPTGSEGGAKEIAIERLARVLNAIETEIPQAGAPVRLVRKSAEQLLPKDPEIGKLFDFEDALHEARGYAADFRQELELAGGALLTIATRESDARARYRARLERVFSAVAGDPERIAASLVRDQDTAPVEWMQQTLRLARAMFAVTHIVVESVEREVDSYKREESGHS